MNPLQEYPFNTFIKAVCLTDPNDPNFDKPLAEVNLKSNPNRLQEDTGLVMKVKEYEKIFSIN